MNAADRSRIDAAADRLCAARRRAQTVDPLGDLGIEDAYEIQRTLAHRFAQDAIRVAGFKIGLTDPEIQNRFGIDEPTYGRVLSNELFASGHDLRAVPWVSPRIEPELAIVLGAALRGGDVTAEDVAEHVEAVVAAFEIVDSHFSSRVRITDIIADNGSCGGAVVAHDGVPLASVADAPVTCAFRSQGEDLPVGSAAGLDEALQAVAWLVRRLDGHGEGLRAGQFVLTGAVAPSMRLEPGSSFEAEMAGVGTVTARFDQGTEQER